MVAKHPTPRISILLYEEAALSLALLLRDIFERANQLLGRQHLAVKLVGRPGLRRVAQGQVTVGLARAGGPADYLVVSPVAPGADPFAARLGEQGLIRRLHASGSVVCSACLGSLVVAQAGVLAGRAATTHWAWLQRARERFPSVHWDARKMICDSGQVVTAGGYMAVVDLALFLVARTCSRPVSHELGRLLLTDSVRQLQSVYATSLVEPRGEDPRLQRLERWLEHNLSSAVRVADMAEVCRLSPRTFHRELVRAYGFTPKKLLQLKRIEKLRRLLRRPDLSVEEAVSQVGLSDLPSFRKVFRRELGLSPAEYRRRLGPARP